MVEHYNITHKRRPERGGCGIMANPVIQDDDDEDFKYV